MRFESILSSSCTRARVSISSKKKALQTIAECLATHTQGVDEGELLQSLFSREKLGSTGIGNGIAIPHCRTAMIDTIHAICITTENGIDFGAIDNQPVDIIFAMVVPENCESEHLSVLAEIATTFQNTEHVQNLRDIKHNDELYQYLITCN